ncbi:MAG: hypothetical protein HY791_34310 [Deltaproteobacteria bacterium]|nr:hypothetical protein [Deltaproteobacteria bacterium]
MIRFETRATHGSAEALGPQRVEKGSARAWFMAALVVAAAACVPSELERPNEPELPAFDGGAESEPDGGLESERKRVFFFRNGTLGKIRDSADSRDSLGIADEDCTSGAERTGLGGLWRAWLSSSEIDAIDRVSDVGPWYRLDRKTLLFASKAELAEGPRTRIDPTEQTEDWESCARSGSCGLTFWSGTDLYGRRTSDNCLDWTVYNRPAIATVGRADVSGPSWVAASSILCSAYLALLCIEQ